MPMNHETLKQMKELLEKGRCHKQSHIGVRIESLSALVTAYEQLRLGVEVVLRNAQLLDRIHLWSKCADGYPLDEHINNITTKLEQLQAENERLKRAGNGCALVDCPVRND